jgi:Holliday junction resolvase
LGNIVTDQNQKTTILESSPSTDEKETKKIPFVLRGNEAVLVYLENKKKKYAKVTLYKKEMEALPM